MADVTIVCPSCGKKCTVSEYAAAETLICVACAHALKLPEKDQAARLQVRKAQKGIPTSLTEDEGPTLLDRQSREASARTGPASTINEVHKVRTKVKTQSRILGLLVFLVLGGALVGAQYYIQIHPPFAFIYNWTRYIAISIAFLVVIMVAADDSYVQAILCALVPFYIVYYVFARMEYLILRSIFAAVVVMIGTELYFMRGDAVLTHLQQGVDSIIVGGGNLIHWAGESPDLNKK